MDLVQVKTQLTVLIVTVYEVHKLSVIQSPKQQFFFEKNTAQYMQLNIQSHVFSLLFAAAIFFVE